LWFALKKNCKAIKTDIIVFYFWMGGFKIFLTVITNQLVLQDCESSFAQKLFKQNR